MFLSSPISVSNIDCPMSMIFKKVELVQLIRNSSSEPFHFSAAIQVKIKTDSWKFLQVMSSVFANWRFPFTLLREYVIVEPLVIDLSNEILFVFTLKSCPVLRLHWNLVPYIEILFGSTHKDSQPNRMEGWFRLPSFHSDPFLRSLYNQTGVSGNLQKSRLYKFFSVLFLE